MDIYKEKNRGITLIALVITIILLLILAGITILQLTRSGLFEKAKIAKIYSREAQAEEKVNLEIIRVQMEKEGIATIKDIYNDFSSNNNKEIDVIQVNRDDTDENIIREIIVSVIGYEEFNFTIGEGLEIIEICGIPKNEWKGETLDNIDNNEEDKVLINNSDKLTEGTTITIHAKQDEKIKKVDVEIGNINVYSQEILNKIRYVKTINLNEMQNIEELEFNKSYKTKVKITLSNGNIIEENGIDILNYTISDAQALKELSNEVNSGNTFEEETLLQIADIDLSSVCSTSIGSWEPIGTTMAPTSTWFNGTYNGNKKEIRNLYINHNEDKSIGLFGFLGYKGIIKNVVLYGEVIQNLNTGRVVGGIVGRSEGIIENCINYANVTNNTDYFAGGIAGGNENIIRGCINNGNITGIEYVGGISAMSENVLFSNNNITTEKSIISNCINNGNISGEIKVGGICGEIRKGAIEQCINNSSVIAVSSIAGGIVGQSNVNIINCKNIGDVTTNGNPSNQIETQGTGGIVGRSTENISCSSNKGKITSKGYHCGGILGVGSENTTIEKCYNIGSIQIEQYSVGGIVGINVKKISNCYNYLDVNKTISAISNAGGIMGNSYSIEDTLIENCYSIGENINGNINATILANWSSKGLKVDNCYFIDISSLNGLGYSDNGSELAINNIYRKPLNDFKLPVNNNNSVAYLLNANNNSGVWEQNSEINNGLPILSWQLNDLKE